MCKIVESDRGSPRYLFWLLVSFLLSCWVLPAISATDLGLSEADCRCCHGTTLADRHHLLVNTSGRECLSCHTFNYNTNTLEYDISITRDCIQCHTGSLADRHHLLVDQVNYDCFTCHTIILDPMTQESTVVFNNACQTPPPPATTGTITGSVWDINGPALGWVRVASSDGSYTTLATETGNFELLDIPPGSYTLVATLDGYIGSSHDVTVVEGQRVSVVFSLSPLPVAATISGVVRDPGQTPLDAASITSIDGIYSTTTAVDGTYTLNNVAEGTLQLTVTKAGYVDTFQSIDVIAGEDLSLDFALSPVLEICTDGIDNNANGLIDCSDPACSGHTNCQPPAIEICGDSLDNDDNGLIDCKDPACIGSGSCESPVAEICDDQIDNNNDGLLDCSDPLCNSALNCLREKCKDGIDNNGDNLIDCADPLCADTRVCRAPPVEICDDNIDNDDSGKIDCEDHKCDDSAICGHHSAEHERCSNGIDDNNDGFVDCADAQCALRAVCLDEICNNQIDDDADGRVDCEDRECRGTPACAGQATVRPLYFTVSAADEKDGYEAAKAGDGDPTTRWWAENTESSWMMLDLGGRYPVNKIKIDWHAQFAKTYKIRISKNGRYWKTVKSINNGDGGTDEIYFRTKNANFVLIECIESDSTGYSIYDVKAYRSGGHHADDDDD